MYRSRDSLFNNIKMTTLLNYGWNDFHQEFYNSKPADLSVGRVISIQGFKYILITSGGEMEAELSGRLLFGSEGDDLPKVGDWVSFLDYGESGYIVNVFPRENELSRKNPGPKTEKQILAANIDYALVVQALDRDFNIMRLERYLVQIAACRIKPVVVLNKVDLVSDPQYYRDEISRLHRGCPVFLCSTITGQGIDELIASFEPGKTYILIGSSGVGKSSLLNLLMNNSIQKTAGMSDTTMKGKHTTSTRSLFLLPGGGILIDTPGMREFGLTFEETGDHDDFFPQIKALAGNCRYPDCRHIGEAGCSVLDALHKGRLDADLYESYLKLMREQKRFEMKAGDKKRLGKQFGKMTKEAKAYRKKYKY